MLMLRRTLFALVFLALAVLPLEGAAQDTAKAKFKLGTVAPADSPWHEALLEFKNQVAKRGGMQVQLYMGGTLGSEAEMVEQVKFGSTECIGVSTGAFTSTIPSLEVFEIPFIWDTPQQTAAAQRLLLPYFNARFEEKGIHLVGWSENGWRNFMTNGKPIEKAADLQGMKMRSQESPLHIKFWQALGAKPVPLPTGDFAKSMASGLIQGGENSVVLTAAFGWMDAIKSFTVSRHIYQPAVVVCNKAWFDKLPEKERSSIDKEMAPIEKNVRDRLVTAEHEFLAIFKERGINVVELTPEARADFVKKTAALRASLTSKLPAEVLKLVDKAKASK